MATQFPAQIDTVITLPTVVDNTTALSGSVINRLRDAIIAVETEAGIKPSGLFTTIRARLDSMENLIQSAIIGDFSPSGDLSGNQMHQTVIGLQTNPIAPGVLSATQDGYVLTWVNAFSQWTARPTATEFVAGGDLSGTTTNQTVIGLQTNPVKSGTLGALQDGYVLTWVGTDTKWEAKSSSASLYPQTVWHLNQATGNDSNDGLTSGTAIKTGAELARRMGQRPYINYVVDVYIHADMDPNDTLLISGQLGPNGALNYHGVPTVIHSGVLSGVTAFVQTTNQADELTDGLVSDWTPYIGSLVQIATGDVNGPSYCWVAAALTGPARARVSFLGQRIPGDPYFENIGPATVSNAYQIWQLPVISNIIFDVVAFTEQDVAQIFAEFLSFPYGTTPNYPFVASECIFIDVFAEASFVQLNNPLLLTAVATFTLSFTTCLGLMLDGYGLSNGTWVAYGLMMQNSQIYMNDLSSNPANSLFESHHAEYGIAIFDCHNPFILEQGATMLVEAHLWGQNNTGTTITLTRGGRVLIDVNATFYVTNSGNDFTIDGFTELPAIESSTMTMTSSRALSFTNFFADVSSGGFGGSVFNPKYPNTGMIEQRTFSNPNSIGAAQDGYVLTWVNADGYWEAKPKTGPFTQATWYIDPANSTSLASDANSGIDSTHPVLSYNGGIVSKWGTTAPTLQQNTTFIWMSSATPGEDPVVFKPIMVGAVAQLQGTLGTPILTGTLGTVTAKNVGTGTLLQADLGSSVPIGSLVKNTHAGKLSYAWVYKIVGTVATLTQPLVPSVQPFNFTEEPATEINTWATSDSFQVFTPTNVEISVVRPEIAAFDVAANFPGCVQLYQLNGITSDGILQDSSCYLGTDVTPVECSFQSIASFFDDYNDGLAGLYNNFFAGGMYGHQSLGAATITLCGGAIIAANSNIATSIPWALSSDVIIDGYVSTPVISSTEILQLDGYICIVGSVAMSGSVISVYNAVIWGPGKLEIFGTTRLVYQVGAGMAAATFQNTGGLTLNSQTSANSFNPSTGLWSAPISITPANLDLAFSSGGFGGLAINLGGASLTNQGTP